jgi:hypothetical protein
MGFAVGERERVAGLTKYPERILLNDQYQQNHHFTV